MKKVLSVFLLISILSFAGCSTENNIADIDNSVDNLVEESVMMEVVKENDWDYICNLKSMKFHLPTCHTLPNAENSDYISSREQAIADGYIPCKNCNP